MEYTSTLLSGLSKQEVDSHGHLRKSLLCYKVSIKSLVIIFASFFTIFLSIAVLNSHPPTLTIFYMLTCCIPCRGLKINRPSVNTWMGGSGWGCNNSPFQMWPNANLGRARAVIQGGGMEGRSLGRKVTGLALNGGYISYDHMTMKKRERNDRRDDFWGDVATQ